MALICIEKVISVLGACGCLKGAQCLMALNAVNAHFGAKCKKCAKRKRKCAKSENALIETTFRGKVRFFGEKRDFVTEYFCQPFSGRENTFFDPL